MEKVVNALRKSINGIIIFTADVNRGVCKVTVFCTGHPDMGGVVQAVTGANTTATITYAENQGAREITVTWTKPDTSNDKAIAHALQEQENACDGGGASRGGASRGSAGRGGGGSGGGRGVGMVISPDDMLSDSDLERWLAAGGDGHVDVGAGCGDHGAISALQQARNMWQEQTYAEFACAGGHGGAGADGHTNEMTDAQFAEWLAKGGASADGHHGVYPTTVEELRKMDL
jgi:hypothetical protein